MALDETLLLEIVDNQGWSFPLHTPLVLDSKLSGDKTQKYLRLTQYINQDGLCLCQKPLGNNYELHHALISRKDAMGLLSDVIHSSYNTVLLHPDCHRKIRRSLCLLHLANTFDFADIQRWYREVKNQMKIGGFRNVESFFQDKLLS